MPNDKKDTVKKVIEIPEYLFKYSSTFFKTASKKDVFFKKMFNHTKPDINKNTGSSSARQMKGGLPEHAGKSVKKTDMSMVNFHLDIKES